MLDTKALAGYSEPDTILLVLRVRRTAESSNHPQHRVVRPRLRHTEARALRMHLQSEDWLAPPLKYLASTFSRTSTNLETECLDLMIWAARLYRIRDGRGKARFETRVLPLQRTNVELSTILRFSHNVNYFRPCVAAFKEFISSLQCEPRSYLQARPW